MPERECCTAPEGHTVSPVGPANGSDSPGAVDIIPAAILPGDRRTAGGNLPVL